MIGNGGSGYGNNQNTPGQGNAFEVYLDGSISLDGGAHILTPPILAKLIETATLT
jgi:hypothetical protein